MRSLVFIYIKQDIRKIKGVNIHNFVNIELTRKSWVFKKCNLELTILFISNIIVEEDKNLLYSDTGEPHPFRLNRPAKIM